MVHDPLIEFKHKLETPVSGGLEPPNKNTCSTTPKTRFKIPWMALVSPGPPAAKAQAKVDKSWYHLKITSGGISNQVSGGVLMFLWVKQSALG